MCLIKKELLFLIAYEKGCNPKLLCEKKWWETNNGKKKKRADRKKLGKIQRRPTIWVGLRKLVYCSYVLIYRSSALTVYEWNASSSTPSNIDGATHDNLY